jgi:hypothetical protein
MMATASRRTEAERRRREKIPSSSFDVRVGFGPGEASYAMARHDKVLLQVPLVGARRRRGGKIANCPSKKNGASSKRRESRIEAD